jgi:hypothetical protein
LASTSILLRAEAGWLAAEILLKLKVRDSGMELNTGGAAAPPVTVGLAATPVSVDIVAGVRVCKGALATVVVLLLLPPPVELNV